MPRVEKFVRGSEIHVFDFKVLTFRGGGGKLGATWRFFNQLHQLKCFNEYITTSWDEIFASLSTKIELYFEIALHSNIERRIQRKCDV